MAKNTNWQDMMEEWFVKLPNLPKGGREFLVQVTPWLSLFFGALGVIFGVIGLLGAGFLSAMSTVAGYMPGPLFLVSGLIGLASSALLLVAFPGLKDKKMKGWNMLFWSRIVALAASVVYLNVSSVFWGVVFAFVSFYLLYQIKSYYK